MENFTSAFWFTFVIGFIVSLVFGLINAAIKGDMSAKKKTSPELMLKEAELLRREADLITREKALPQTDSTPLGRSNGRFVTRSGKVFTRG